jgi:hypothetical protein
MAYIIACNRSFTAYFTYLRHLLFPLVFIYCQISIYRRDAEIAKVKLFFLSADPRGISFAFHREGGKQKDLPAIASSGEAGGLSPPYVY